MEQVSQERARRTNTKSAGGGRHRDRARARARARMFVGDGLLCHFRMSLLLNLFPEDCPCLQLPERPECVKDRKGRVYVAGRLGPRRLEVSCPVLCVSSLLFSSAVCESFSSFLVRPLSLASALSRGRGAPRRPRPPKLKRRPPWPRDQRGLVGTNQHACQRYKKQGEEEQGRKTARQRSHSCSSCVLARHHRALYCEAT